MGIYRPICSGDCLLQFCTYAADFKKGDSADMYDHAVQLTTRGSLCAAGESFKKEMGMLHRQRLNLTNAEDLDAAQTTVAQCRQEKGTSCYCDVYCPKLLCPMFA
jgi:hypothetical protein